MPSSLADFEILYTIGSGSYGTCKKIRRKSDGKVFVWKEMDYGSMTETEKQMLVSEVNLLRELKHENIVRYHERVVDKKNHMLYLIMEYCEGGDLAALIKRYQREGRHFEEETIWKVLAQCASALSECHKRKDGKSILHRDLKPANVFLDLQKNVKLGDFGLARVLHETSFAKTFVGTPYYMSPEQMNKQSYNEKSDIWSLGCVLYEMCTLRPPFLASNQRELAVKIRMGHYSKIPYMYSTGLDQLIRKMLSVECVQRPSIKDLLMNSMVAKYLPSPSPNASGDGKLVATSSSETDLTKKTVELNSREQRIVEREAKCLQRETQIKSREAELRDMELRLQVKEKELERRERELHSKENAVQRQGLVGRDSNIQSKMYKDLIDQPLTPILCRARKACDSPSKHVSFQAGQDKENDKVSIESTIAGMRGILNPDDRYDAEYQKRRELRERLEKAKQRANQLRTYELKNRTRANNLLNVR